MNSKNEKLENITRYPVNFSDAISINMKNRNMVGIPIEEVTLVNNLVTSAGKVTYKNVNGTYLPDFVQKLNVNSPVSLSSYNQHYTDEFKYDEYDKSGNVVQLTGRDNSSTVYLWSYNRRYPVIEVKGVTYDEVKAASGSIESLTSLQSPTDDQIKAVGSTLREYFKGKAVLVTTYTYKPLVGVSSIIDPAGVTTTYEYDPFGRLQTVKDHNGNILNHYDYHYKNN